MYGDCHPVDILKDPTGRKGRRNVQGPVPKPRENVPGPSGQIPNQPTAADWDGEIPPISPTELEMEMERGLDNCDLEAERVWQQGGVKLLLFLTAKAISPIATAATDPKTWAYKDIKSLSKKNGSKHASRNWKL